MGIVIELLGYAKIIGLLTVSPVDLGDGPYVALEVQCNNGPLIQAFADGLTRFIHVSAPSLPSSLCISTSDGKTSRIRGLFHVRLAWVITRR